jgi:glycogen operon protein
MTARETTAGRSHPVGATVSADGVNFCVYSKHATAVELLLFDGPDSAQPAQTVRLDPGGNRTYHYWHVEVRGVGAGQVYGYRVLGPNRPEAGLRFDPAKLLLDPYARAVVNTEGYQRSRAAAPGDNTAWALRGVVVDPNDYAWEGDTPLRRAAADPVIYEMHVAGFTRHPNSGVTPIRRGTFAGLIEKIPYLRDLGVAAVELMPVQQFDAQAAPVSTNYWGYQSVAWFAPHRAYSSRTEPLGPVNEFRDLVKALHRAGIEVILDVVFNHTAEGNEHGPTLSLRGLDNPTYYLLKPGDPAVYIDDTGCGHTVNGNETVVRRMILDCLRYWVEHMHVDGFRFDLASTLSRGEDGTPLRKPPLLMDIEADPVLAATKIIAEAWDAAGLYQVADFAGDRWAVWNGRFRDEVRRFVRGDRDSAAALADGLVGSAGFFNRPRRDPLRSVNFITAHDGFTLNDLVSFDCKHNEANGEQNRDGTNDNYSWNCGVEGPTDDPAVEALRRRQIKNFITILLLSQGRPMLLMGDEIRRTQGGNNNGYCQDNELSWLDWGGIQRHGDLRRFMAGLIGFHERSSLFRDRRFWGRPGSAAVTWHGVRLNQPDWGEDSHSLAYELVQPESQDHLHVMLNAYWEALAFALPPLPPGRQWHRLVDTTLADGRDYSEPPSPLAIGEHQYRLEPRSSAVLLAGPTTAQE